MIVFAVATVVVALGFALIMHGQRVKKLPQKADTYRRRYQMLMARMEMGVLKLNTLGNLAPHVKNSKVLDEYESCLRMMESLLTALVKLPQFGFKDDLVGQVQPLVMKTEEKIEDSYRRFKDSIEEKSLLGLFERYRETTTPPASGCYFCSRPYMKAYFKPASIRVDGIKLGVFGCHICVAELKATKKVRVLYFMEGGQSVHWTLLPDYKPSEQFWNLNRRQADYKEPEIELLSET